MFLLQSLAMLPAILSAEEQAGRLSNSHLHSDWWLNEADKKYVMQWFE